MSIHQDTILNNDFKALFSLNIVLPNKLETVPGAILIQNERIVQILETTSFEVVSQKYSEYIWHDFSEYFISPGLIDLNVCFNNNYSVGDDDTLEYETSAMSGNSSCLTSIPEEIDVYESGTKTAVEGGVTLIVESPSLFTKDTSPKAFENLRKNLRKKTLFSDLALLAPLNRENFQKAAEFSDFGAIGFKSFLLSPGQGVEYLQSDSLGPALKEVAKLNKTIFFHPEKTNERFLYMSSPFRNESFANRKSKPEPVFSAFPAAFPEDIENSGSEVSPISSSGSTPMRTPPLVQSKADEIILEKQVIFQSNNLESLIKAEIMTYSTSGLTIFDPNSPVKIPEIKDFSLKLKNSPLFNSKSPVRALPIQSKVRRPPPITCVRPSAPKENTDYKIFLANCPPHWEVNGVQAIIAELKKCPEAKVHISNLSSATAVYAIRKCRKDFDLNLTCETSSFYLYFSDEQVKPGDTRFKANPPIREEKNKKLMIEILNVGGVDVVSSYHRNVLPCLKFLNLGDFKRALSGVSSLGFTLQTMCEVFQMEARVLACKIARVLSEGPAKVLGLSEKGSIDIGKHADLVVWDPFTVNDVGLKRMSPFSGEKMKGKVLCTFIRGKLVYSSGCFWPFGKVI